MLIGFALADGDVYKGQTYYRYYLYDILGYDGAVFAKKYTAKEWREIFKNRERLTKELSCGECEFLNDEVKKDLEAFAIYYAKDSDAIPTCE